MIPKNIFLLFVLVSTVHVLSAEAYMQVYTGAVFGREKIKCITTHSTYDIAGLDATFQSYGSKSIKAQQLIGAQLGGWIAHNGDFGIALDCQYHRLNYCHDNCKTLVSYYDTTQSLAIPATAMPDTLLCIAGPSVTLAVPFAWRWGFLSSDAIPRGRLNVRVAIGPTLVWLRQHVALTVSSHEANDDALTVRLLNTKTICACVSKKCAGLSADFGLSYLFSRAGSVDVFARYRFAKPCLSTCCVALKPTYHLFSINAALAYHF